MNQHQQVIRSVNELIPYANNSRTHDERQIDQVAESIKEFGFTNPILIDEDNGVIAGHGRLLASKKLNLDKVPCIILNGLSDEQKKAYVIADNKLALNAGWNDKMLMKELFTLEGKEFDLLLTGFSSDELKSLVDIDITGDGVESSPQIVFSEEVDESHNYVVLYFSNDIDWLSARTHFDLESVHSKRCNGKPWSKGIGRVVNGAVYLSKLKV
jgi:ParB-like chromosome segregation protein Spo0J